MKQITISLQNHLERIKNNTKDWQALLAPEENKVQPKIKIIKTIDNSTQTEISDQDEIQIPTIRESQDTVQILKQLIKRIEEDIQHKYNQNEKQMALKLMIDQKQEQIKNLKTELADRLQLKYGPEQIKIEKNKQQLLQLKRKIKMQQQANNRLHELNEKSELAINQLIQLGLKRSSNPK